MPARSSFPRTERKRTSRASQSTLLATQLVGLLVAGAVLGAVVPAVGVLTGLAGGMLASAAVAVSALVRAGWRRSAARHPHWAAAGPELLTREVVRTGVGLMVVLLAVAPLALSARVLPLWALAAVTAGVSAALPSGVAIELRAADPDLAAVDRRRLWHASVALVTVAALAVCLVAALAGLVDAARAFAWTGVAAAAFGLTALVRASRWALGS